MAEKYTVGTLEPREPIPGHRGRFIHSKRTTHVYWEVSPGAQLPEHSHPHEQIVNLLDGKYELVVDGTPHLLESGDVLVIPGGAVHSGIAHAASRILDVFSPVRDDYR